MEELMIYKFQAEEIKDALRMVSTAFKCQSKTTCLDRTVCRAQEMIEKVLATSKKKQK